MQTKNAFIILSLAMSVGCSHSKKVDTANSNSPAALTSSTVQKTDSPQKTESPVLKEGISESIKCLRDSEIRTIEIEMTQPKGCNLWYTRFDNKSAVASSKIGKNHCEQVLNKIRSNLEAADFKCSSNDLQPKIQSSPVTNPEPKA